MNREALNALNDNISVDVVDYKDAVGDVGEDFFEEKEASVDAIPDMNVLTGHFLDIMIFLEQPEIKAQCKIDDSNIRVGLINKYADSKLPLSIIDMLMEKDETIRNENIERTLKTFETLLDIKEGRKDLSTISNMEEELNERYLYTHFGGKQGYLNAINKQMHDEKSKIANARTKGI